MWLVNDNLKRSLVLPIDGKPVTEFDSQDKALVDICTGIKPFKKMEGLKELLSILTRQ